MIDPASPETLSAYIDGELTSDERRRVEAHLASSPESRRLVDELRTLSAVVGGLPRHASARDMAAEVMDQAHTRRAAGPLDSRATALPQRGSGGDAKGIRRFLRPAVWSGLTVAAAILVMVLADRPDDSHRRVTQRLPESPPDSARAFEAAAERASDSRPRPGYVERAGSDEAASVAADAQTHEGTQDKPASVARFEPPGRSGRSASVPAAVDVGDKVAVPQTTASRTRVLEDSPSSLPILVIHATLRGDADAQTVRSLVVHQGIAWQEPVRRAARVDSLADADGPSPPALSLSQRAGDKKSLGDEEIVYVEATAGQVEAMLAAIDDSPEQWTDVSVRQLPVEQLTGRQRDNPAATDVASSPQRGARTRAARESNEALSFNGETDAASGQSYFAKPGEDIGVAAGVEHRQGGAATLPKLRRQLQQVQRVPANMTNWRATARVLTPDDAGSPAPVTAARSDDQSLSEALFALRQSVLQAVPEAVALPPLSEAAVGVKPQASPAHENEIKKEEIAGPPEETRGRVTVPVRVLFVIHRSGDAPSSPGPAPAKP